LFLPEWIERHARGFLPLPQLKRKAHQYHQKPQDEINEDVAGIAPEKQADRAKQRHSNHDPPRRTNVDLAPQQDASGKEKNKPDGGPFREK
jgi:hypothetical protein